MRCCPLSARKKDIYKIRPATRPATSRPLTVLLPSLIAELLLLGEVPLPVTAAPERPVLGTGTALVGIVPKDVTIVEAAAAPAMLDAADDAPAAADVVDDAPIDDAPIDDAPTDDAPALDDPAVDEEFAVGEVALTTLTSFFAFCR